MGGKGGGSISTCKEISQIIMTCNRIQSVKLFPSPPPSPPETTSIVVQQKLQARKSLLFINGQPHHC